MPSIRICFMAITLHKSKSRAYRYKYSFMSILSIPRIAGSIKRFVSFAKQYKQKL